MSQDFSILNYMEVLSECNNTSALSYWELNEFTLDRLGFEMMVKSPTFKLDKENPIFAFGLQIKLNDNIPNMMIKLVVDKVDCDFKK